MVMFALGAFLAGPFYGLLLWLLLAPSVRRRAYDVCQAQARIEHGAQPVNEGPPRRRRSPDHQLVTRPAPDETPRIVHDMP